MTSQTSAVASVTYDDKALVSRVTLDKKDGYELTASVNTPFTEEYSLHVSSTGNRISFENEATVQWSPSDKITASTSLNLR